MPPATEQKPARLGCGVAVVVALITGIAGCVLAVVAGDYLTELDHVSNMEGGRGLFVVFCCAPIGIVAGIVVGLIVALRARATASGSFLKAQGLALLVILAVALVVTGLFWLGADKPPKINGRNLTLDFELRVPPTIAFPADPAYANVHASLYAGGRDNRYAEIDFRSIHKEGDTVIVPGTAALLSHSLERSFLVSIETQSGASQFIPIRLPAAPGKENEMWSDWIFATQRADLSPVSEAERLSLRYRVQTVNE